MSHPDTAEVTTTRAVAADSDGSLVVAVVLVVLGMDVFIIQPGFVQGLVDSAGYDPAQAGLVAASEMFGIAAATVAMTWCATRLKWRHLVRSALLLGVCANLLSLTAHSPGLFCAWRCLAGLASGALISIGYVLASKTSNPDRSFGWIIMWVLVYGALGIFALPALLPIVGLQGLIVFFAVAAGAGWLVSGNVPDSRSQGIPTARPQTSIPIATRVLLLAAVLCYFLGQGTLWAYLSLAGIAAGGTDQEVATALTIAQFLGIAGAFTAATLGTRLSHRTSMVAGSLIGTAPLLLFLRPNGAFVYALAVCTFNYAANYMTPMLTAVVARADASGKLVVQSVALQMLGLAAGPAIAAPLIRPNDYSSVVYLGIALLLMCLVLVLPPLPHDSGADT